MESDIHNVLTAMMTAWNDGDATAYAGQFTQDADYITFFGLHTEGRAAIEESHRMLFEGPLKGSRMTAAGSVKIKPLSTQAALVICTGGSSLDGGDEPDPDRDSIISLTAVREQGRWLFSSFQNTRRSGMPGA